jgi:hypothetical protein
MRAATVVLLALVSISWASISARASDFSCPAEVENDETAGGQPESFKFRHVSFYDGDPSELADLAPDEGPNPKVLEQSWTLTRTAGRPIVMVCRYHGTDMTVRKEVPPDITECRLEGLISEQGEIQGSPTLTCR